MLDEIVADNVTDLMRGVIDGGTGSAAEHRSSRGRQDGLVPVQRQRVVRRLHADAVDRGVDGQDRRAGPAKPLLRIKGVPRVYGGTIPARTWKAFMSEALKDVPVTDFNEPAPISSITDRLSRAAARRVRPR